MASENILDENLTAEFSHTPLNIRFEYSQKSHPLPYLACDEKGMLYSGSAKGQNKIVDWSGCFLNGIPHGLFNYCWGDHVAGTWVYKNGIMLEYADAE